MSVTDEMYQAFRREAESNKWDVVNDDGDLTGYRRAEAQRAGIAAAMALMPVPTDAEVNQQIEHLVDVAIPIRDAEETAALADCGYPRNWGAMVAEYEEVRTHLLRLIAQREAAARKEALEDAMRAIDADIPDEPNAGIAFVLAEKGAKRARFIVSSLLTQEDTADEWPTERERGDCAGDLRYRLPGRHGRLHGRVV